MDTLMMLDNTMDTLMMSDSQVHALNILRALYKDSRLGEVVTPFVADGLMAAILGFQSPFWAVSVLHFSYYHPINNDEDEIFNP